MNVHRFVFVVMLISVTVYGESKTKNPCDSIIDCEKKSDLTSIHRKKITFLTTAINEYSKDANIQSLIPLYLKRIRSIILEANGETGYTGEIVLKVSHKPEYKVSQMKKAEEDLTFLEKNFSSCSDDQKKEFQDLTKLLKSSQ